jgi:hypothetical protein
VGGTPKHDASLRPGEVRRPLTDPALVGEAYPHRPLWKFGGIDMEGQWGWRTASAQQIEGILGRCCSFESMTWREIEQKRGKHRPHNHPMPISQISRDAQARLRTIERDDEDGLYSLRINNLSRIWGFRRGHVFHVLWWDPDHTVYPIDR